jgi:cytochrome c-type protein NapC
VSNDTQNGNGTAALSAPEKKNSLWRRLRRPSVKYSVLTLLVLGFVAGIIFWGGFNTALEATNTEAFCISCHEMRDNTYPEYLQTIHNKNRVGVRATCPDCHVPHPWVPKIIRKIQASGELWGKLTGAINTREKFQAKRLELARMEWARMKANQSQECRNCHAFEHMDMAVQKQRSRTSHEMALKDSSTCIDCHKGIAHHKPEGMTDADDE